MRNFLTRSRRETVELGRSLGARLKAGDVAALSGTLGTGKTSLVTGICDALGVKTRVTSPTFVMVNEYEGRNVRVIHIDLYRVRSIEEVAELGLEEYFNERSICLIEWPEHVRELLPQRYIEVKMEHGERDDERRISVEERETGRDMQSADRDSPSVASSEGHT